MMISLIVWVNADNDIEIVKKYNGKEMVIYMYQNKTNLDDYYIDGVSIDEDTFRWTEGKFFNACIICNKDYDSVSVEINISDTFNGYQECIVKHDGKVVKKEVVNGANTICFEIPTNNKYVEFSIELQKAARVSDINKDSNDDRELALQLKEIILKGQ